MGGREHPEYKTLRKKILNFPVLRMLSLAASAFRREQIRKWSPSASLLFYFSFFFFQEERPCVTFHVILLIFIIGDLDHLYLFFYSLSTYIVFSGLKYSTLMRNVSAQMYAVSS